eukprot:COSAG05_NODE_1961_length_3777_cov_28.309407_1_plen_42_part_10
MNQSAVLSEAGNMLGGALGPPPRPAGDVTFTGFLLRLLPTVS